MPTLMITGASRGIGLEFGKQYAADGWHVIATCRDPGKAEELRAIPGALEIHQLDVTDSEQIGALRNELGDRPIDVLINNAGIYGPRGLALGAIDYDAWREVLAINVEAPIRILETFRENVARSEMRRVANISSLMGSIGANTGGGNLIYRSSKACLNAATRSAAFDLVPEGVIVIALSPGWVRTDMGGSAAAIAVEDSVAGMRTVIDGLEIEDHGKFFGYDGREIPW